LGGNPGSFGVLVEIEFECVRNADHPYSGGFKQVFPYNKKMFKAALEKVQEWTERIQIGAENPLPDDVDMCITVTEQPYPILLVELVHGNASGAQDDAGFKEIENVVNHIKEQFPSNLLWWVQEKVFKLGGYYYGKKSLSELSESFVRPISREFELPYKKRLNCTMHPLCSEFVEGFTDMVTNVLEGRKVTGMSMVFQMFIGGGKYRDFPKYPGTEDVPISSINYRNVTHGLVFDIFYKDEDEAIKQQQLMKEKLLPMYESGKGKIHHDEKEIRMFWGTFDDVDIRSVVDFYYENREKYDRLLAIKDRFDSANIFNTKLTVKPLDQ